MAGNIHLLVLLLYFNTFQSIYIFPLCAAIYVHCVHLLAQRDKLMNHFERWLMLKKSWLWSSFQAPSHVYGGHSSHVTNVTFLYNDSCLVSTGGKDMSVMQWRIVWATKLGTRTSLCCCSRQVEAKPDCTTKEPIETPNNVDLNWGELTEGFHCGSAFRSRVRWSGEVWCVASCFSLFFFLHSVALHGKSLQHTLVHCSQLYLNNGTYFAWQKKKISPTLPNTHVVHTG